MTDGERRALVALARMCERYLSYWPKGEKDPNLLDHMFMSAGERAIEVLAEYGFARPIGRGGVWTKAGRALLNSSGLTSL